MKIRSAPGSTYDPNKIKEATGNEVWRKWEIVYTGNARVPFWIVRVPKEIISGHGGLWSLLRRRFRKLPTRSV